VIAIIGWTCDLNNTLLVNITTTHLFKIWYQSWSRWFWDSINKSCESRC
jgi:hypothetical protein